MQYLYYGIALYLLFSMARILYQLSAGFLYVTPLKRHTSKGYLPLVSIVIPAWNEAVGITRTIRSVMKNGYPNIEVIVVDDGSTDATAQVVSRHMKTYRTNGRKMRLMSQWNAGKANALNHGITTARGELILTLDADSYLEPGSIRNLVRALSNPSYSIAIGEVVIGNTKTLIGKMQHYEYLVGFHFKRSQRLFNSAYIFPGALTMFRHETLQDVGKFKDYSSTEDLDISMRIKAAGYRVAYVDSAVCMTEGAATFRDLLNQRTRWRHGFISCVLASKRSFVLSTQKGRYLSFVDFPLAIIGVFEIFFYPLLIAFTVYQLRGDVSLGILLGSYLLLPFVFLLLVSLHKDSRVTPHIALLMPLGLIVVNTVEYIALLKSIYRTLRKQRTSWTIWQRSGAG